MHRKNESSQAKKKISSISRHLSNGNRRKESLRRTWSHDLPSLATNTVKMFVATLHIGATVTESSTDKNNELKQYDNDNGGGDDDDDDNDDDDNDLLNLGQEVQAHIPDIVLNNLNDLIDRKGNISIPNEHKYENSTLLFLDVSGFTSLTEQYSNAAHLGIDQLTRTLNSYFDKLVYEILTHDGDIYKFAGDAILSLWTDETTGPQKALKCALHLQQKCGAYETDVGVILRLKVALAYGSVCALFVGTEDFKHYLLTGDCIKNVNACEQLCEPGDIIITKAIYDKIQSTSTLNCEFVPVSEDIDPKQEHIAVKYSQSRRSSVDEVSDTEEHINNSTMIQERMDISNQEITNDVTNNNHNRESSENDLPDDELYVKIDVLMKSFLLHCVYQRIERKQSLDYLSELRRVTISFINLDIVNDPTINDNMYENIHKIFVQIYELTKMMGGVLTKGLLFDKGWSFLCVYGLPGYKQGDDTANALKSAQMIHSTIQNQCKFVEKCSIGVTTGLTYCGVVGHRARCEYTVIGRKVNMAARLMCNYPNIISCDQETYYNSRLSSRFFQILPDKTLKGMNNVGVIWHYCDNHDLVHAMEENKTSNYQLNDTKHEDFPLLGRRVELMIVAAQIMLLDEPVHSKNRRRELAAIIFEGEDKIGRSRLLQFIAKSLENSSNVSNASVASFYNNTYIPNDVTMNSNNTNIPIYDNGTEPVSSLNCYSNDCAMIKKPSIHVINYRCQLEQRFNEFSLLRSLLRQLLQFHHDEKTQYEREQYLLRLFDINKTNDLYLRRNLFVLNDLLDVRFRHSHIETENNNDNTLVKTYESNMNEVLLHILNKLIDIPNNIAELYQPTPVVNSTNTCPIYLKARLSTSSTASLTTAIPSTTVSKIIFIIDDIHFADESSLKHLLTLGSHQKCLLILSVKPPRKNNNDRSNSNILQSITTDSRVYLRRLPGLELRYLATLGCQMLSVHRLPAKLVKVFNESCNGIPGFCEQIVFDLLSKDKIYIDDNNDSHDQDSGLVEGDPDKILINNPIKTGLFKTFFSRRKQEIKSEQRENEPIFSRICLLRDPTEEDFNADCQQNFQNYIMCRIDRLSEGESLLVKIAAIIGYTFSRTFLWYLVDPQSKKLINIHSCILEMMQRNVIECAFGKQQQVKTRTIKCYCLQNPGGFPSQCRLMAFTHSTIREGINNSLTDGLKRSLTRNAIEYLEKQSTILCLTCGAGKNDSPFLVLEQDGLAKFLKNRQQPAFVDIVKMAALKEIDDAIKNISRTIDSPSRTRSNTGVNEPIQSFSVPNANEVVDEENIADDNQRKRRNSVDTSPAKLPPLRRPSTLNPTIVSDDDDSDDKDEEICDTKNSQTAHRESNDPNLTLISVYSPDVSPTVEMNVKRAPTSPVSRSSQLFSLFRLPLRRNVSVSESRSELLHKVDGTVSDNKSNKCETIVEVPPPTTRPNKNRLISFIRYLFCQFTPIGSNATVAPSIEYQTPSDSNDDLNKNQPDDTTVQTETHSKATEVPVPKDYFSHWKKVRKAILPASGKIHRAIPNEDELLAQPMFSLELMKGLSDDLNRLNKQISLTRSFEVLYDESLLFHTFQSYVRHNNSMQYVYDQVQNEEEENIRDLNEYLNEFTSYNDLRICECIDYVMSVYIKLVEYHTNLYDIYEKMADDKRDYSHLKQFDRIMYYRTEICRLLLRCNCLQRLLVEIENGMKFLEKFQNDTNNGDDFIGQYQYLIIKYTYDIFQATLLQRTRAINDSKQLCEKNLKELNQLHEDKIWDKLIINTKFDDPASAKEKRQQFEHSKDHQSKDFSIDSSHTSTTTNSEQFILFTGKYRLEYLLCQYNLLLYDLSRHQSTESITRLIDLQYYTFPLSFSLSCTVILVEYFYCQKDYNQCLALIDKILQFWWPYVSSREKLEFGKLKCLSLIIELKQGSIDSAIISGYFAKRILTNYHENIFLCESCIYLTFALICEMRVSNIELILQHLEYLSEQTMNCYAKLWYYILVIDVGIELGYELMPITIDLLDNITKYRKKLRPGPNERTLLLVYTDCTLAQIYARLGLLDMSKIHFHLALHQIKYDQMHLSNSDFRLKRALLKLVEIQLLHWYYKKESDENFTKDLFFLHNFNESNHEEFIAWNKTRFCIYQAYYDRLINDYRRQEKLSIDNDYNWETNLHEAEKTATKLDLEWIECLRSAWSLSASEQIHLKTKHSTSDRQVRRPILLTKHSNRRIIRPAVPHIRTTAKNDINLEKNPDDQFSIMNNSSHQKFVDWRSCLNNNSPHFQLYILPVKV
ncbi:unnamed protein product [Adineta steineri]|uniref:Guanylate cyclase domain-containing protein n=1 Tax=Adineta steineri TaxID=433720 RepID=A0A814RVU7_9BILA|nr:unnamed protein product [Adineta steineri]